MTQPDAPAALVLEQNPFIRSTFLGLATKLNCPLFVHDDPRRALICLRENTVGVVLASRRILVELDSATAGEWMMELQRARPRMAITLTRGEPPSVGKMPWPLTCFLQLPCTADVACAFCQGTIPMDEAVVMPGTHATPPPFPAVSGDPGVVRLEQRLRGEKLINTDLALLDHFQVLGVTPAASRREILNAYLDAVRRFHPDALTMLGDTRLAQTARAVHRRITDAWQTLGNEERRVRYLNQLRSAGPTAVHAP